MSGAAPSTTTRLQNLVERLQAGDPTAADELIERAADRLRRLTHKMLQTYPRLKRWEETDDVLQNALLRLHNALKSVKLVSTLHFIRLATEQIRRELIDLTRHYCGPQGLAAHHATDVSVGGSERLHRTAHEESDSTNDPQRLAAWREFHEHVETLPESERDVFEAIWYHEMTYDEASQLLNVPKMTVRRLWLLARLHLGASLGEWRND